MKEHCLHRLAKYVLIAALLPVCWAALEATGGTRQQGTMVLQIKLPPQIIIEEPGCIATPKFDLYSTGGEFVGGAIACVTDVRAKSNAFGTRIKTAHFTFNLPTGQLEADLTILESTVTSFPGKKSGTADILQAVSGAIVGGNGVYTGAKGTIWGGGTITFTADGPVWDVSYVLDMK